MRYGISIFITLLTILTAGGALANMTTQTVAYGPFSAPRDMISIGFNKFDGSLGTLTGVAYRLSLTASGGTVKMDNEGPFIGTSTSEPAYAQAILHGGDPMIDPAIITRVELSRVPFELGSDDNDGVGIQESGPDYDESVFTDSRSGSESASMDSSLLGLYVDPDGPVGGLDAFNVRLDVLTGVDFAVGSVRSLFLMDSAKGELELTYEYDAALIPLPAAVWLLGSGLIVLAGLRKKILR